jgi:hypothetical protein
LYIGGKHPCAHTRVAKEARRQRGKAGVSFLTRVPVANVRSTAARSDAQISHPRYHQHVARVTGNTKSVILSLSRTYGGVWTTSIFFFVSTFFSKKGAKPSEIFETKKYRQTAFLNYLSPFTLAFTFCPAHVRIRLHFIIQTRKHIYFVARDHPCNCMNLETTLGRVPLRLRIRHRRVKTTSWPISPVYQHSSRQNKMTDFLN